MKKSQNFDWMHFCRKSEVWKRPKSFILYVGAAFKPKTLFLLPTRYETMVLQLKLTGWVFLGESDILIFCSRRRSAKTSLFVIEVLTNSHVIRGLVMHVSVVHSLRTGSQWALSPPRSLCSPNSSVSRSLKFFSVLAGSLFAGYVVQRMDFCSCDSTWRTSWRLCSFRINRFWLVGLVGFFRVLLGWKPFLVAGFGWTTFATGLKPLLKLLKKHLPDYVAWL